MLLAPLHEWFYRISLAMWEALVPDRGSDQTLHLTLGHVTSQSSLVSCLKSDQLCLLLRMCKNVGILEFGSNSVESLLEVVVKHLCDAHDAGLLVVVMRHVEGGYICQFLGLVSKPLSPTTCIRADDRKRPIEPQLLKVRAWEHLGQLGRGRKVGAVVFPLPFFERRVDIRLLVSLQLVTRLVELCPLIWRNTGILRTEATLNRIVFEIALSGIL